MKNEEQNKNPQLYKLDIINDKQQAIELGKAIRKRLKLIKEIAKGHKELIEKLKKVKPREKEVEIEELDEDLDTSNLDMVDQ